MLKLSRVHSSRFRLILFLGLMAASACGRQQQPAPQVAENEPETKLPVIPKPEPPIDRAALLGAVREAASASAAGIGLPESVRDLEGKQFELRIRFGCRGASDDLSGQSLGWSYDAEENRLRVRAQPTISKKDPLVAGIAGEKIESVEGFWIPRPWLLQAVCPGKPAQAASPEPVTNSVAAAEPATVAELTPAAPRIGIAQFFTPQDPRTRQRGGRAYEAVKTVLPAGVPTQGFNLVLAGRLRALGDRGVIQCVARNPASPPECVISAEFLHAWIERPGSGEIVAEWGGG